MLLDLHRDALLGVTFDDVSGLVRYVRTGQRVDSLADLKVAHDRMITSLRALARSDLRLLGAPASPMFSTEAEALHHLDDDHHPIPVRQLLQLAHDPVWGGVRHSEQGGG